MTEPVALPRIACLLPSATEIVGALGMQNFVVAVTHECDLCPDAAGMAAMMQRTVSRDDGILSPPTRVTSTVLNPHAMSQQQIDAEVKRSVATGLSLYAVDTKLLTATAPTLVITQALCAVCAPATAEVDAVCAELAGQLGETVRVLSLQPANLHEVASSFEQVAMACGAEHLLAGQALRHKFESQLAAVHDAVRGATSTSDEKPSVLLLEWLDPPYDAGHWVPGQIKAAGCHCAVVSGVKTNKSAERSWDAIMAADPDCILIGCCGFGTARNHADVMELLRRADMTDGGRKFRSLRAVQAGAVFAVDANRYFARPSPSLAAGAAIAARCAYADRPEVIRALDALDFLPPGLADRAGDFLPPGLEHSSKDSSTGYDAFAWARVDTSAFVGISTSLAQSRHADEDNKASQQSEMMVDVENCWKKHEAAVHAGEHGYTDPATGYFVFTELAHKERGACCGNGCRHCAYAHVNVKNKPAKIQQPAVLHYQSTVRASLPTPVALASRYLLFFTGNDKSIVALRRLMQKMKSLETISADLFGQLIVLTCFDAVSRQLSPQGPSIQDVDAQLKRFDACHVGIPLHSGLSFANRFVAAMRVIRDSFGEAKLWHIWSVAQDTDVEPMKEMLGEASASLADSVCSGRFEAQLHFPFVGVTESEIKSELIQGQQEFG